jgi:hypothetical protein
MGRKLPSPKGETQPTAREKIGIISTFCFNSTEVKDPTHPHLGTKKRDASQKFRGRNWTLGNGTRTLPRIST